MYREESPWSAMGTALGVGGVVMVTLFCTGGDEPLHTPPLHTLPSAVD